MVACQGELAQGLELQLVVVTKYLAQGTSLRRSLSVRVGALKLACRGLKWMTRSYGLDWAGLGWAGLPKYVMPAVLTLVHQNCVNFNDTKRAVMKVLMMRDYAKQKVSGELH